MKSFIDQKRIDKEIAEIEIEFNGGRTYACPSDDVAELIKVLLKEARCEEKPNTVTNDLKPCPRCNSPMEWVDMGECRLSLKCTKCPLRYGSTWGNNGTEDEIVIEWNNRDKEYKRIAKLMLAEFMDQPIKDYLND